ncbi:MAG: tetratricopeptide repeat protein [Bryobacterales bacterium]|nr:tetratricopeptide repeat protein [Bryobacterales bacterium]
MQAEPVPLRAYNDKGQLTGSGWAVPVNGAWVTVRSLLANAARAELVFSSEMRAAVEEVGSEDVEGNLVIIAAGGSSQSASAAGPSAQFELSSDVSLVEDGAQSGAFAVALSCGAKSFPLRERQVRDIPVFGLVFLGQTDHRDSISGCPILDSNGSLQAIAVWENPFGQPSVALVPASRIAKLSIDPRKPWAEWRDARQHPPLRLRNSLINEALEDIWRGHYDLAIESLTYLLQTASTDARAWYYRGYARAMSGRRQLAMSDYENAVHFEPSNAEARFSLGFTYALLRRTLEAKEQVKELQALDEALAERLSTLVTAMSETDHEDAEPGASLPGEAPVQPTPVP